MQNNKIFSTLIWGPVVIIPTLVILVLFVIVRNEELHYRQTLQKLENDIIEKNKKRISEKINGTSKLISYEKSTFQKSLYERIKMRVDDANKIALNLYLQYNKSLSEKKLQSLIIDALRPLLWNEEESFIWVIDYDGILHLAPEYLRHLEGNSVIDFKDSSGKEIIKEEISLCKSSTEGFIWDTFFRPDKDTKRDYRQLAFVKAFGHYNWFFGSGEYLDTAIKKADKILLNMISTLDHNDNEHIFIIRQNGDLLLHSLDPSLEGENIFTSSEQHLKDVVPIFNDLFQKKSGSFVSYNWQNPLSKTVESKITYIMHVPETDWIIGSGFYVSDMAQITQTEKTKISLRQKELRRRMFFVSLLLISISFVVAIFFSNWIKREFHRYEKKIKGKNIALKELNVSLEQKVKVRTAKLEMANAQLEKIATTDALTQVYNRYYFMQSLEAEEKRFHRYKKPFCLIMYDIDFFKIVNDRYGHQKGDEVLITITDLIGHALRESDTLFRFGGEEFMVLLPETELDEAFAIAKRMRERVEEHDFNLDSPVTISLGVIEFQDDENVDSIIRKVDDLLYQSKDEGRNTVSSMSKKPV